MSNERAPDKRSIEVNGHLVTIRIVAPQATTGHADWPRDPEPYRVIASSVGQERLATVWEYPFDWQAIEQYVRDWIAMQNPFGWTEDPKPRD
jgi:hypothetical protein